MTRTLTTALVAASLLFAVAPAGATSRIKDLANVEGIRQNQLIGYGLVVGLNGTGDGPSTTALHQQSLGDAGAARRHVRGAQMRTGNVWPP